MEEIENLVETLALEPIEVNLFRGASVEGGGPRVFGGHVIAQALPFRKGGGDLIASNN